MAAKQKHITLLEEAENRLRRLSPERMEVVLAFLAYLHETEENKAIEELLSIPGFAASFCEGMKNNNNSDDVLEKNSSNLAQDTEVWEAYLTSKKKWKEVYRRLANS